VVVVGSLNVDLVVSVERLPRAGQTVSGSDLSRGAGGKGLNQAVAAARAGARVAIVGSVGDDGDGAWLREFAVEERIDTSGLMEVGVPTGTALITVGRDGANTIVVSPGANEKTVVAPSRPLDLGSADVLLCQAEIPAEAVTAALAAGRDAGAVTVLNQAPYRRLEDAQWGLIDVLVVNETELAEMLSAETSAVPPVLDGDRTPVVLRHAEVAARALLDARPGLGAIVVTLGRHGAVATAVEVPGRHVPGRAVTAVDTVGAGDCLTGWLAAGLADGLGLADALELAVVAASLSVQRAGAASSMPTRAEVVDA
jgi:ribokinase